MSKETLLHHIVDPNAVAEPSYVNHLIVQQNGEMLSGILDAESADAITLKMAGGEVRVLPRTQLKSMESTGRSFMPEGLEATMSLQDLADLITFLQSS